MTERTLYRDLLNRIGPEFVPPADLPRTEGAAPHPGDPDIGPAFGFHSDLVLRLPIGEAWNWTVEDELRFSFPRPIRLDPEPGSAWITAAVPAGTATDLASVPRWLRSGIGKTGPHVKAAVVHDWIYRDPDHLGFTRAEADRLLHGLALAEGMNRVRAFLMWAGVRAFGWHAWGKGTRSGSSSG